MGGPCAAEDSSPWLQACKKSKKPVTISALLVLELNIVVSFISASCGNLPGVANELIENLFQDVLVYIHACLYVNDRR
jgi:hypothetical protein